MRCMTVIPAKLKSERLPFKNWRSFNEDQSLVEMAVDTAELSCSTSQTVVSVDDKLGLMYHKDAIVRDTYCSDISEVAYDAIEQKGSGEDYVVTLQPTCPARTPEMVDLLVSKVHEMGCNGGVTVTPIVPWHWSREGAEGHITPFGYTPSQDCQEKFQEINAIQVASREAVMNKKRWDYPMCLMVLPPYAAIDIDHPKDMHQARRILPAVIEALKGEQFEFIRIEK